MHVFLVLVEKLTPLYLLIVLGYVAGRFLRIKKEPIAVLLIYVIAPVVVFNGVASTKITVQAMSLPILFFSLCCLICLVSYQVFGRLWVDSTKNILASAAGTGNTGYFGIPVAATLFGDRLVGLVILSALGFTLYENTLGFYMVAKGSFSGRQSLRKVIKLPTVYAFFLGFVMNLIGFHSGPLYQVVASGFKTGYTILGMMVIGMALATNWRGAFDRKFVVAAFGAKFLVWPATVGTILLLNAYFWHFYDVPTVKIMVLMSIVPLAAHTVIVAAALKVKPEKVAITVLLSTLFALIYIPLVVVLLKFN